MKEKDTCDVDPGWAPLQSFEIDDGSIAHLSPVEAFVLGVEWQTFYALALEPMGEFHKLLHIDNADRVAAMMRKYGWHVKLTTGAHGWCEIAGTKS